MRKRLARYVFVGAFQDQAPDGTVGGQSYACRIILKSPLSDFISWKTVDSTVVEIRSSIARRTLRGLKRFTEFAAKVRDPSVDGVLIFSSGHLSFVEKGLMALLADAMGKRVVFCPRSGLLLDDLRRSRFMRWFVPMVFRHSDVVVCQGHAWAERFRSLANVPAKRFVAIPNWIDPDGIPATHSERISDSTVFLYLGHLEFHKGIFDLIEAVSSQREQLQGARFLICGEGSEAMRAKGRVSELGLENFFKFCGWVHGSKKEAILQQSDVLVLPSHTEGMPNAVLEAMARGLSVIATRVGGVPDILVDDSLGVTIEPGDSPALGLSLVQLHQDPLKRRALGAAGREHVLQRHDFGVIWRDLLAILVPATEGVDR